MAKKSKSFKKYGRKEDESADDFLDRVMGNTKKEREKNFYNTLKELGMLDDMVKAKQLDDEARRRRTQLGNKRTKTNIKLNFLVIKFLNIGTETLLIQVQKNLKFHGKKQRIQ